MTTFSSDFLAGKGKTMTLLEKIREITNLPWSYINKYAEELIDAYDSYGLLHWLEGVHGVVRQQSRTPDWTYELWMSTRHKLVPNQDYWEDENLIHWDTGIVSWQEKFTRPGGNQPEFKTRQLSVGKWLRKVGATNEEIKEFETRKVVNYEWRISTRWYDILTMSFPKEEGGTRGWRSCMRPDQVAEQGIITDMKSGAAILFFYQPGKNYPVGRLVLRPSLERDDLELVPTIILSPIVYGEGTSPSTSELSRSIKDQTGIDIPVTYNALIDSLTLFNGIYDDNAGEINYREFEKEEKIAKKLLDGFSSILCFIRNRQAVAFKASVSDGCAYRNISNKKIAIIPPTRHRSKKGKKTKKTDLSLNETVVRNRDKKALRQLRAAIKTAINTLHTAETRESGWWTTVKPRSNHNLQVIERSKRQIKHLFDLLWREEQRVNGNESPF